MITADEFDAHFDSFRANAYRLEALPAYDVGGQEAERIAAFQEGRARPERSVRTSPWLARIALSTIADGKSWDRTRILDEPLTDYERYELGSYVESQACGDRTRIAMRADVGDVGPDFWLFDVDTPHVLALVMHYDPTGQWLGAEKVADRARVADLVAVRARVDAASVPLNDYLAGRS